MLSKDGAVQQAKKMCTSGGRIRIRGSGTGIERLTLEYMFLQAVDGIGVSGWEGPEQKS